MLHLYIANTTEGKQNPTGKSMLKTGHRTSHQNPTISYFYRVSHKSITIGVVLLFVFSLTNHGDELEEMHLIILMVAIRSQHEVGEEFNRMPTNRRFGSRTG